MTENPAHRDLVDAIADNWRNEMPGMDSVEYQLARRATRLGNLVEDALASTLVPWRLTGADFGVLNTLRAAGVPYELRPSDLKVRLLLTSGGVSNVLTRLGKAGLVERERDSSDGRSSWVRLTPAGVEVAEATARAWADALSDMFRRVRSEVSQEASDTLRSVLIALGDLEPAHVQAARESRGRAGN
ncbi:MarR family winged helix-turn-helix transcriptional regulator [Streptomyces sp. NPDC007148]|uniref:MarR family winged helix-turn-helix transcriptional regulator n=1 Tax=unclassified Streptomyces TaxID=2593676 RepID=UPI003418971B